MRRQLGSFGVVERDRIDLETMGKRQSAPAQPHRLRRRPPVRSRRSRKAPEIVEADLRRRKACKLRRSLRVQIAQHPIAQPVVGQRPQLLLDQLERPPERGPARQRLLQIEPAEIEPQREQAGEPAHRARELDIRKHLLAPVTLQIEQHRSARAAAPPPAPVRNRHRQPGQQHVVDAAMERRRHPRQQRRRELGRQREREVPGRAADVAHRIERAVDQRQRRLTQHGAPQRKLRQPPLVLRVRGKPVRPAPERGPARRRRRHQGACKRLPRPPQAPAPGCATTPRPPPDDGWSATAGRRQPRRRRTTPPAPSPRPPAQADPRPLVPARQCRRAALPHQARRCRCGAGSRPPLTVPGGATSRRHGGCCRAAPSRRSRSAS